MAGSSLSSAAHYNATGFAALQIDVSVNLSPHWRVFDLICKDNPMKLIAALIAAAAIPAFAADEAATKPAAAPVKHSCEQPEFPGRLADQAKFDRFNKKYKAYGECMRKFIDEQAAISNAAAAAGNAAINEYNSFVKSVNEQSSN
jgi:hypothetical protein